MSAEPVGDAIDLVSEIYHHVAQQAGDVDELIEHTVRRMAPLASDSRRDEIIRSVLARVRGVGELDAFLVDDDITEVLVNAGCDIWVERDGTLEPAGTLTQPLTDIIERILAPIGRRVDRTSPIVDARLPDGSRVCAVVEPISVDGPCLSIRRFSTDVRPLDRFTCDVGVELVGELIERRLNVVVSGATSSGKTSLLASLLSRVPAGDRIVVLEDTTELPVAAPHVVRLEARPASIDGPGSLTLTELVRTALRLRPDRLVVGEIRGDEVLGLVQALNTGHDGSLSTVHANGPLDALLRLESLVVHAAPAWPLSAIRHQLSRSIDAVVHVARRAGGARQIETVVEVGPPADGAPTTRELASIGPESALVRVANPERRR